MANLSRVSVKLRREIGDKDDSSAQSVQDMRALTMSVAHNGRRWQLAPSLIALEAQADRLAPRRSRASDGSIGDQAHSNRHSDHNPSGGYVHAIDITHDPKNGMDIHAHARNMAARKDGRLEYIISNWMIAERETGFRWRRYTGSNGHTHHAHFSIRHTTLARFDTSPWFGGLILFPTPTPPVYVPPVKPPTPTNPTVPSPVPNPIPTPTIPALEDDMFVLVLRFDANRTEYWLQYASGHMTMLHPTKDLPTFYGKLPTVVIEGVYNCDLYKSFMKERPFGSAW